MRIDEQGNVDNIVFDGREKYGIGSTQGAAYADAIANSALVHRFTVAYDMVGEAHVTDLDSNNAGGLTFEVTRIPEPSAVVLMAFSCSGLCFIRRRFPVD